MKTGEKTFICYDIMIWRSDKGCWDSIYNDGEELPYDNDYNPDYAAMETDINNIIAVINKRRITMPYKILELEVEITGCEQDSDGVGTFNVYSYDVRNKLLVARYVFCKHCNIRISDIELVNNGCYCFSCANKLH